MILYHGSTVIVQQPQIITRELGRDFGSAFYTTDIREQAIRWAKRQARLAEKRTGKQVDSIISVYEWERNPSLNILEFNDASMQWLDMVLQCRSNPDYHHDYDIVIGKIANDNVGETVSYVLQGIMRKEDAIERLKFERINNQIAFCSEKSWQYLKFIESIKV